VVFGGSGAHLRRNDPAPRCAHTTQANGALRIRGSLYCHPGSASQAPGIFHASVRPWYAPHPGQVAHRTPRTMATLHSGAVSVQRASPGGIPCVLVCPVAAAWQVARWLSRLLPGQVGLPACAMHPGLSARAWWLLVIFNAHF
jgi:hypothetical protein